MRPYPDKKKGVRHNEYDCCHRPNLAEILSAGNGCGNRTAGACLGCRADRGFLQALCRPSGLYLHGQDADLFRDRAHVGGHRRLAAVAWPAEGRPGCGDDAEHPADAGGNGCRAARRLHRGQCQPALHAARTRAPAQGFGRQGDHHPREFRRYPAASDFTHGRQACLRGVDGRSHGAQGPPGQFRCPQGQEDGSGLVPARPCQLQGCSVSRPVEDPQAGGHEAGGRGFPAIYRAPPVCRRARH